MMRVRHRSAFRPHISVFSLALLSLGTNCWAAEPGDFVVFGSSDVEIAQSNVSQGAIGSNGVAVFDQANIVYDDVLADHVVVNAESTFYGDLHYNELTDSQTASYLGNFYTPVALPVLPGLPELGAYSTGTAIVNEGKGAQVILSPGDYDSITIGSDSDVEFSGGTYNVRAVTIGQLARVSFSAPTQINVLEGLFLGKNGSYQGNSGVTARDVVFHFGGEGTVTIDAGSTVEANFVAPAGSIVLNAGVNLTGALLADTVFVNRDSTLTMDNAFGAPSNSPPTVVDDEYVLDEDAAFSIGAPGVLANDNDPDGDPLTAVIDTPPSAGTVELNTDGAFQYTPNPDFYGTDTFTYFANDGKANSDHTAHVIFVVNAVNDAPVANDDFYSGVEDTSLVVIAPGVLVNDSDKEGSLLTAVLETAPANGVVNLAADGAFTYTPSQNFNGVDSFTYVASDGSMGSGTTTVIIDVTAVNDPPLASDDAYTTDEDVILSVAAPGVLANDADVEGDPLTAVLAAAPANGSATLNADGSFSFTPNANFNGVASFTYTANDGLANSLPATVTVYVEAVNEAPVLSSIGDQSVNELDTLTFTASASDVDGTDVLTFGLDSGVPSGASIDPVSGVFNWTPTEEQGPGIFATTVRVTDDGSPNLSDTQVVTITVGEVNVAPELAAIGNKVVDEGSVLSFTAIANDADIPANTLTFSLDSGAPAGASIDTASGAFNWTPSEAQGPGVYAITVRVSDSGTPALDDAETISVTVNESNGAPAAVNDAFATSEDTLLSVGAPGVLANDSDPEGDALTILIHAPPGHGELALNSDGSFVYDPDLNFNGSDEFSYSVSDGLLESGVAVVSLTVHPVNDAPVASADSYTTAEDTAFSSGVPGLLGNDSDPEGDTLTASVVSAPGNGSLILNPNGSFTYTPQQDFSGIDSFTYAVNDGLLDSISSATVVIDVINQNDPPDALDDAYATNENGVLSVAAPGVLVNDLDPDGSPLTAAVATPPTSGTVSLGSSGSLSYSPNTDFFGTDTFTYVANDGLYNSPPATVTVVVNATNDPPIADAGADQVVEVGAVVQLDGSQSSDPEGDTLFYTWFLSSRPAVSEAALSDVQAAQPTFTADTAGNYVVQLIVYDGNGASPADSVLVSAGAYNAAPVAANDRYAATAGETLQVSAPGILANDFDPNDDPLALQLIDSPSNGGLTLNADGSFEFAADAPATLDPVLKWKWTGSPIEPPFHEVIAPPVVGNLTDDNGDGLIDENDIPDVVFSTYQRDLGIAYAILRAVDGGTGAPIFDITEPTHRVNGYVVSAIGDIDNDGLPEIVAVQDEFNNSYPGLGDFILVFNHDGTLKWRADKMWGCGDEPAPPSIADLDGDGFAEIIIAGTVHNHDGTLRFNRTNNCNSYTHASTAVDLDLDGDLEVLWGFRAWNHDGSVFFVSPVYQGNPQNAHGSPGIGNFDDDPYPEIVIAWGDQLFMLEHTGQVKWLKRPAYPDHLAGNAIVSIADVNDDGISEIISANQHGVYVFNGDGSTVWSAPNAGDGYGTHSATVFDLDNDGAAELLIQDRYVLRIRRAATGEQLHQFTSRGPKVHGVPIVVDVDNDGHAEILTFQNDSYDMPSPESGIWVYESGADNWARARRIWNQLSYHVTNVNEDGSIPRHERKNWLTEGMNHNLVNSFTPDDPGRADRFTYQVSDGELTSNVASVAIEIRPGSRAPIITSSPVLIATAGLQYQYQVAAFDPDVGDTLTYSVMAHSPENSPGIDAATGLITWLPAAADVGDVYFTVTVSDPVGKTATQNYTVSVSANAPPQIESQPVVSAITGKLYSYDVEATDADGDALIYSLDLAQAGMQIDGASGLITWTPTAAHVGLRSVSVRVEDGNGGVANQDYDIVVKFPAGSPPAITSSPALRAFVDTLYNYDVEATDADGDPLTYSLSSAPAGMSIDASTGLVSWIPVSGQLGSQEVTVRVEDGRGDAAVQTYTLLVTNPNQAPVITSAPPVEAYVGQPYQYTAAADDPDGDPISFVLTTGPVGMSIDPASGLVQWTPTGIQIGDYDVAVRASDGFAYTEQLYALSVTREYLDVAVSAAPRVIALGQSTVVTVDTTGGAGPVTKSLMVNGAPVVLDVNGQAVVPGDAIGGYELLATATDGRETVQARAFFSVSDPADNLPPDVAIAIPGPDAEITAPVSIVGTATDTNLVSYEVLVSAAGEDQFAVLRTGATPVVNGVLAQFDPTLLLNGIYDVVLTATDANGRTSTTETTYRVTGDMKVGHFSFTIEDLSIPVSGIPIRVLRTYDTRRKHESLDFGYGWTVDYQDVRIQENRVLGTRWQQTNSGGPFPEYCIEPVGQHYITITLPDGRVEEFDMRVTPECQALVPNEYVVPSFEPRPGTHSTLVAEDVGDLQYTNGELLNLLGSEIGPYDPTRFTLTTAEGLVFDLDQNFGVRQVTDRNGNTLTYSNAGIVHSSGKSVLFERDSEGRITATTDPNGNQIRFEYDTNGDLVSVTDRESHITRHTYDRDHYLTDYLDARGISPSRFVYDTQGRLVASIDPQGNRTELAHNVGGRQEIITDKLGDITVHTYNEFGDITSTTDALGNVSSFEYDSYGNVIAETDPLGGTTTRTYDSENNLIAESDALGNTTLFSYNDRRQPVEVTDPLGRVRSNIYDANGNLISVVDADGNVTSSIYDSLGNLMQAIDANGHSSLFVYDGFGRVTQETDAAGATIAFTYDANGNRLTQSEIQTTASGARTVQTGFGYDANGNLVQTTDALGSVKRFQYSPTGQVELMIDELGRATRYDFDILGNPTRTTYPDGSEVTAEYDAEARKLRETDRLGYSTAYLYNAIGQRIQTIYADGSSEAVTYDALGQVLSVTDQLGQISRFEYDAIGRLVSEDDAAGATTSYEYDRNGNLVAKTDANGNLTRFEYDTGNRRIATIYANSTRISRSYDGTGQLVSETNQAGVVTRYEYDPVGQLIRVVDGLGNQTGFGYDELGNIVEQVDANGNVTLRSYDALSRLIDVTLPGGQREEYAYDSVGNIISKTDFGGDQITYEYDALDQNIGKIYPDGSTVNFQYSANGQVVLASDSFGTTFRHYDEIGRLGRIEYPGGIQITYSYDPTGNRVGTTTAAGSTNNTFDAQGRLTSVTDRLGQVTSYGYDPVGNPVSTSYPDGSSEEVSYDALNRPVRILHTNGVGDTILDEISTYDDRGHRLTAQRSDGTASHYQYDDLGRLTREEHVGLSHSHVNDYSYDAVGNRLTVTTGGGPTVNCSYDENDRLQACGSSTYTYDANGRTLTESDSIGLTTYSYDYDGRLTGAALPNGSRVDFEYDSDGDRVRKIFDGVESNFLVDKNLRYAQVLEETDEFGALRKEYVRGNGLISSNGPDGVRYFHDDALGNTRSLTNEFGDVTDVYDYEAFGALLRHDGSSTNSFLFGGEQLDSETSHYYLRARYMDPTVGRFLTADIAPGTIRNPITLNRYLYGNANPLSYKDPSGMFSLSELSITMSWSFNIRTSNVKNLTTTFFGFVKIGQKQLKPAYRMQEIGYLLLAAGYPEGQQLIQKGRELASLAYKQLTLLTLDHYARMLIGGFKGLIPDIDQVKEDLFSRNWNIKKYREIYDRLNNWLTLYQTAIELYSKGGDTAETFEYLGEEGDKIVDSIIDLVSAEM